MTEMQKLLSRAYSNISRLTVSGEAVMILAYVMQDIRDAMKITEELDKEDPKEEDDG
jgi:hypothetical protein